jgi:hypothetical protein
MELKKINYKIEIHIKQPENQIYHNDSKNNKAFKRHNPLKDIEIDE